MLTALAAVPPVSIGGLIQLIVYVIIIGLLLWLANYVINSFLPEPFRKVAWAIVMVIAVIFVIYILLGVAGMFH